MTTLISYLDKDGTIYMGADGMASNGWDKHVMTYPKVFVKHPKDSAFEVDTILVCSTGSTRFLQILRYQWEIPGQQADQSDAEYLICTVAESLRLLLERLKLLKVENGMSAEHDGGYAIIGYKCHHYILSRNFAVEMDADRYLTGGIGVDYAKGALVALEPSKMPPIKKVLRALKITEQLSGGIGPPYTIMTMHPNGEIARETWA